MNFSKLCVILILVGKLGNQTPDVISLLYKGRSFNRAGLDVKCTIRRMRTLKNQREPFTLYLQFLLSTTLHSSLV